ncbi:hypothetical protein TBLA_0H03200 [Henningerozyma blattae CBS 6284]|uniref:Uncharacterized protein n=1 Tax=Henningerozyma blattae (strain ATCC 34711 / CBS 6284 / DSM 70876 / NBRC 10599 / NRRL Y-10934 / UCD 77-7) TaxID=1071380 RepID=I2H899_HENB6|nr:hypothetical protein TBLA_0H03200 [Tetrapisispora blattae CBS 6284]CCH62601.1 hypothetical protein TBLA_0H03200 [Tetrapisispora blattae CBS 6284]
MVTSKEECLRDKQVASILRMLFLNDISLDTRDVDATFNSTNELNWKVLVMDAKSTSVVSSVLRVKDLLKAGVTVHTLIEQERASLPDVPAVYFISPTKENLDRVINDLKNDYYLEYYINFNSSLPRQLLEYFAKNVAQLNKSDKIKQLYDQYLDFLVTEKELFSLQLPLTYSKLNNPQSNEDIITQLCENIATGLFNIIITTNIIPIIRAPVGGPAEMVAGKLGSKLRDYMINMRSSNNNASNGKSTSTGTPNQGADTLEKSVLILLDRNIDFTSMFNHSWIYQCMVFDIFKLQKNIITIPIKQDDSNKSDTNNNSLVGNSSTRSYDLEPTDFFWNENSHLPFPEAAENVENSLADYKEKVNQITKKTGVSNINDIATNFDQKDAMETAQFQEVIKTLPVLTNRKSIIDMHMNIFAALLSELEEKKLDTFFEIEQQDPDNNKTRTEFLDMLNDNKTNNFDDKMRSFIVLYLLSKNGLPKDFINKVETYFKDNQYDITPLKYIYKLHEMTQLSSMSLQNKTLTTSTNSNSNNTNTPGTSIQSSSLSGLYNLTEGRVGSLLSGLKKLLPEKKTIPITNVVEAIMDPLNSSQKNLETTDNYLYIDPHNTRGSHTKKPKRQTYNNSIVFVIGGGNYFEYQNLQEWAHAEIHNTKTVMYGSTDIISPNDFLHEIAALGSN